MSDVFISYKREDEGRVAPLVRALEAAGLTAWWDRGLPGGESWRHNIETALNDARCVVVIWSSLSVGAAGHFVRDEAAHAMARGVLVPVMIEAVQPPLGFRELQAIDLTRWNGRAGDPFFGDLIAAIRAKLDGRPAPDAKGPMARLRRRLTAGSLATIMLAVGSSFAFNAFGSATYVCTAAAIQPLLSDGCGAVGIGGRPTQRERMIWERRRPGSCDDLRSYVGRFPGGAYAIEAANLITARATGRRQVLDPSPQTLPFAVSRGNSAAPTIEAAHAAALSGAQDQAEDICRGYAGTGLFRFKAARIAPAQWNCDSYEGGFVCGLEGHVTCDMDAVRSVETETCGASR